MHALVVIAAVCLQPVGLAPIDVDYIEINHVGDWSRSSNQPTVRETFEQAIFWRDGSVVDWRFTKTCGRPVPFGGKWHLTWLDHDSTRVNVRALDTVETWTLYDVEVAEREILPVQDRRTLRLRE